MTAETTSQQNTEQSSDFWGLLDRILRQREELISEVFEGSGVGARIRAFLLAILLMTGFYGLIMGTSSFSVEIQRGFLQMLASAVKLPLLYLLSLAVCFPVLFIVVVLIGSRLSFLQTLCVILIALTLNAVLLASSAPIVLFFTLTGAGYDFIKLLHVVILTFSGAWAMAALWQGLNVMCEKSNLYPKKAVTILQIWILVFGFVGTQMAWSLRPFIGAPGKPFQFVRHSDELNFYKAVWVSAVDLTEETGDNNSSAPNNESANP